MTARALAAELGVSVRAVYRDLEGLNAAGVPVFAESGPGGGCQILDGCRFPLRALRPDEAEALLILGVPSAPRDLGLDGAVTEAHRQIRVTAGLDGQAGRSGSVTALVHLDMPRWFRSHEQVPHLLALAQALRQQRQLEFRYQRGAVAGPGRVGRPARRLRARRILGTVDAGVRGQPAANSGQPPCGPSGGRRAAGDLRRRRPAGYPRRPAARPARLAAADAIVRARASRRAPSRGLRRSGRGTVPASGTRPAPGHRTRNPRPLRRGPSFVVRRWCERLVCDERVGTTIQRPDPPWLLRTPADDHARQPDVAPAAALAFIQCPGDAGLQNAPAGDAASRCHRAFPLSQGYRERRV